MKRVQAACIMQTLLFTQKEDQGLSREKALQLNRDEFEQYKALLHHTSTRHLITGVQEMEDGSILVHVRKQYNAKVNVDEYFN